jgi:flagellar biosynthesis/type III secretory pathway protein FliH
VLRSPELSEHPHLLGGRHVFVSANDQALMTEAHRRGFAEGLEAGRRQAEAAVAEARRTAIEAIEAAAAKTLAGLGAAARRATGSVLDLSIAMAETVVAATELAPGERLCSLLPEVLDQLEDDSLVIRLNPRDAVPVARLLEGNERLKVVSDPNLSPGEAMLDGRWAKADLTFDAAFSRLREALDA